MKVRTTNSHYSREIQVLLPKILLTRVHSQEGHQGRKTVYCERRRFQRLQVEETAGDVFWGDTSLQGQIGYPKGAHQNESKYTYGPRKSYVSLNGMKSS